MQTKSKENKKKMDKNPVFWFPSILLCYDQNMWDIEGISAILNLVVGQKIRICYIVPFYLLLKK